VSATFDLRHQATRKLQSSATPIAEHKTALRVRQPYALLLSLVLFASAAKPLSGQSGPIPDPADSRSNPDRPALEGRNPRYRVHVDDLLAISFPLSPELNQPHVVVQPDGYINLQGVDSVYVQGLSGPEIVETLKKAYAGTLHDPIISVDITDFQRPFFLVSGQVGKPGQYDLRHDTTVSEAIATAGGFAPTAKTQVLVFHRVSADWVEVKKVNLKEILHGKNVNEDARLSPGDMIFVPEKAITHFRKYVPYGIGTGLYPTAALPSL
jgi:polysaccharide biosynthesis/export protein